MNSRIYGNPFSNPAFWSSGDLLGKSIENDWSPGRRLVEKKLHDAKKAREGCIPGDAFITEYEYQRALQQYHSYKRRNPQEFI